MSQGELSLVSQAAGEPSEIFVEPVLEPGSFTGGYYITVFLELELLNLKSSERGSKQMHV